MNDKVSFNHTLFFVFEKMCHELGRVFSCIIKVKCNNIGKNAYIYNGGLAKDKM